MRKATGIWVCLLLLSPGLAQQGPQKPNHPAKTAAIKIGPGITPPHPIFMPDPEYPLSLRQRKRKTPGICVMGITVDKGGAVRDIHVIRSTDKRFNQSAIDALKRWKFKPAMRDGKPVTVSTTVEMDFELY